MQISLGREEQNVHALPGSSHVPVVALAINVGMDMVIEKIKHSQVLLLQKKKRTAKCTSSPSSLKRKRSTLFHKENEMDVKQGSWTLQETCIIESVESFLLSTTILPSVHNVTLLYNFVINSSTASRKKLRANQKTTEQVRGKLEFSHRRQEALRRIMLYGIASI